jgi:hypothetical protein
VLVSYGRVDCGDEQEDEHGDSDLRVNSWLDTI